MNMDHCRIIVPFLNNADFSSAANCRCSVEISRSAACSSRRCFEKDAGVGSKVWHHEVIKGKKVLRRVDVSVLLCVETIVNEFKSHLTNNDSRHATKVLLILVQ